MPIQILTQKEKAEIESQLEKQFGISKIPAMLLKAGQEKIFFYSGSFNEQQIKTLEKIIPIERIGVYFAKEERGELRLNIEATQLLKNQISKNIVEITENQVEHWLKGRELEIKTGLKGFVILKHKSDFLGTGKASENKIGNFIPKSRRLKDKN